jgi:hypothetical protein
MNDILIGSLIVLIGALFCLRGYLAMRFVIPIWGGFTGFMVGAGLVASFTDEGFLASILSWAVGLGVGLLFALLAYFFYEIAVLLAMGSIGFTVTATVMTGLGITWNWLVILAGVAVGAVLAFIAILGDMPMVILTILTASAGAGAMIGGLLLILGKLDLGDLEDPEVTSTMTLESWWYWAYLALFIIGIIFQIRSTLDMRASLRQAWVDSGGRMMMTA